jgi:hypothetical protein
VNKEQAIKELEEFKAKSGISRDKTIEIYNVFKSNPTLDCYGVVYGGDIQKVNNDEFWHQINTSDIKEIYTTGYTREDFTDEMVKLRKSKLLAQDKLRVERGAFNKNLRTLNTLEELNKEVIENLKKLKPIVVNNGVTPSGNTEGCNDVLLIQLSDLHILEMTNEFKTQQYDLNTASKRLKKFAERAKKEIITKGIKKVVIFSTGDICNSDSLLSKQMNNTANKAIGTIMATILLQHFILDVYSVCNDITVGFCSSNEGRYTNTDSFFSDENLISNCPDFVAFNFLKILFKDIKGIKFIEGRNAEVVVNINGNNILFTHGVNLAKGNLFDAVQKTVARYSEKGVNIRYTVFGHIHAQKLSSFFMRSGSLVGDNAYATTILNTNSRASQNLAFISKNGDIEPLGVDLENVDGITGYDISDEIARFDIKSATKAKYNDLIEVI